RVQAVVVGESEIVVRRSREIRRGPGRQIQLPAAIAQGHLDPARNRTEGGGQCRRAEGGKRGGEGHTDRDRRAGSQRRGEGGIPSDRPFLALESSTMGWKHSRFHGFWLTPDERAHLR